MGEHSTFLGWLSLWQEQLVQKFCKRGGTSPAPFFAVSLENDTIRETFIQRAPWTISEIALQYQYVLPGLSYRDCQFIAMVRTLGIAHRLMRVDSTSYARVDRTK